MTEREIEMILKELKELQSKTDQIYYGLYGMPGTDEKGICGDVKDLTADYYKFKQRAMTVFFFLLGSGALGFGIWELVKVI